MNNYEHGEGHMDKNVIAQQIIDRVEATKKPNYGAWTVGLSHDPRTRREQHEKDGKDTQYWIQWTASSLDDAQQIEAFFINEKGMKGGTGGDLSPHRVTYVYIF